MDCTTARIHGGLAFVLTASAFCWFAALATAPFFVTTSSSGGSVDGSTSTLAAERPASLAVAALPAALALAAWLGLRARCKTGSRRGSLVAWCAVTLLGVLTLTVLAGGYLGFVGGLFVLPATLFVGLAAILTPSG